MDNLIAFGSGKIIAVPTNLADGTAIAVPTPVILADLQDISVDMSIETKLLYGAKRYPIAIGQGKGKIEIKAKQANVNAGVLGSLYLGKAAAAGVKAAALDIPVTIPDAPGPYTLTADPPGSGTFVADLGLVFADTGVQLTRVASAPTTGQYAVDAAGVYTFASADKLKPALMSYEYSDTAGGKVWTLDNQVMGYTPSFAMLLQNSYDGKNIVCKFHRAVSGKLSLPFKSDDFSISDFEAQAFANAAGVLGYICMF